MAITEGNILEYVRCIVSSDACTVQGFMEPIKGTIYIIVLIILIYYLKRKEVL